MNQNPTEPIFSLVLIHTAEGRPLVHIGIYLCLPVGSRARLFFILRGLALRLIACL